jgi:hypothetical protein
MSQTVLPVQKPGLVGVAINYNAVDGVNGNTFPNDGQTAAIIKNGSASTITATFTSVPDPYGRFGDVTVTVPASGEFVVGPFNPALFNQSSGNVGSVNCSFSSATTVTMALVSA